MEEDCKNLEPRNYQIDLIRLAVKQNTIIFLPTGSGKTFIAVCVLKELAQDHYAKKYSEGGKVSVMVANTVQLVHQHSAYFQKHTSFLVNAYTGDMNVDFWKSDQWSKELDSANLFIMTPQILVNCLNCNYIDLNKVNLLIFDECHQAVDAHPMRQVMKLFQHVKEPPRILGLTATLLNGNTKDTKLISEVKTLEVTFHSKVGTVDGLHLVLDYSTNPHEFIASYATKDPHPIIAETVELLAEQEKLLRNIKVNPSKQRMTTETCWDYKLLHKTKAYEKFYRLLMDAKENFEMLGPAGARIAAQVLTIYMECERRNCADHKSLLIAGNIVTMFYAIQRKLDRVYLALPPVTRCLALCTGKVCKLIEILKDYTTWSKEDLCGIVFVQRRNTAIFLHHIITELSRTYDNLSHIKSDFIFGQAGNPFQNTIEGLYYSKMNRKVIDKFNAKEINLLISSNVIEEGIDLPRCTLVVKFDTPTNYREYIQSKGRARFATSLYFIMVKDVEKEKFMGKYAKYQSMERDLNSYLVGQNERRSMPNQMEIDKSYEEEEVYYANGPGSACVRSLSAIQLVMMYCMSFKTDLYTRYEPSWYLDDGSADGYIVYVELPIVCPINKLIPSKPLPSTKAAKRSAAFNACIELHKCGELNDDMLPRSRSVDPELTGHLFAHWPDDGQKNDGVTKKRRPYPKRVPLSFRNPIRANTAVYLHVINLEPLFTANSLQIDDQAMIDLYKSDLRFGFITAEPLPTICTFPLFVTAGAIDVNVANNVNVGNNLGKSLQLSTQELHLIKRFHHNVFKEIANVAHDYLLMENSLENYLIKYAYIVPVQKGQIDFDTLNKHQTIEEQTVELSLKKKQELVVDNETHLRRIVTPYYRDENRQYLVLEVCQNLTANSPFPKDCFPSYAAYFHSKYNKITVNPELPLLLVRAISTSDRHLMPRGASAKKRHDDMYQELQIHLIPEMCVKQEFPACLWIAAKLLPSLMHRIVQLVRAEELRREIARTARLGCEHLDEHKPLILNENLIKYKRSDEEQQQLKKQQQQEAIYPDSKPEQLPVFNPAELLAANKVVSQTMTDLEYPWDSQAEPVDISRNLDVTVLDIDNYSTFMQTRIDNKRKPIAKLYSSPNRQRLAIKYNPTYEYKSIKLLGIKADQDKGGPQLKTIYECLCTAKANDIVNLERLETLGDSLLKLIASLYVFARFPRFTEGQATELKGKLVSNRNLFYLARKRDLPALIKMHGLKPSDEWLPPGYGVPQKAYDMIQSQQMPISSLFQLAIPHEQQIAGQLDDSIIDAIERERYEVSDLEEDNSYASMCSFLGIQMVSDKSLADVSEALIGCYLESLGLEGGIGLIEWLGVIPRTECVRDLLNSPHLDPIIDGGGGNRAVLDHLLPDSTAREIENILSYKFRNKAFLLQALTHSSYTANRLTQSYERLEFIGDAVLDFLITTFVYENFTALGPGQLTDLRSALVNNETFASYVVALGLHKYLKQFNNVLMNNVSKFETYQSLRNNEISNEVLILLDEKDLKIAEHIDCPKVLGDLFESIAGAIYLDCGKDLNQVWKVFHKIMSNEVEKFANDVPINPIRLLGERLSPLEPKFSDPIEISGGSILVKLDFVLDGAWTRVHGFGDKRTAAKKAAAKIALRLLTIKKQSK